MHKVSNMMQNANLEQAKKNANKLQSNGGFDVAEGIPFESFDIGRFCSNAVPKLFGGPVGHTKERQDTIQLKKVVNLTSGNGNHIFAISLTNRLTGVKPLGK